MKKIVVLGGGGFVGRHLVHRLSAAGHQVKVLTRRREDCKSLFLLPGVEVEACDVFFDTALNRAIRGSDAVINLIGILHETGSQTFARIHEELPRRVAQACKAQNVHRLLHMSALQADTLAPSAYLRSKAVGERAVEEVLAESEVALTIFRPSVIFGREDRFLNLFAELAKWLPVMMLASPQAKFQPVYVEDVAEVFARSLEIPATAGQAYALCGPEVYTLEQLVRFVMAHCGLKRPVIRLNDKLSYLQAWFMEYLPVKLMTRDNVESMRIDSVCDCPFPAVFGMQPASLASATGYLADGSARAAYLRFRTRAGR